MVNHLLRAWRLLAPILLVLITGGLRGEGLLRLQQKATLGPARTMTSVASLKIGHAELAFSGRWAPLLQAGKVVGLFLVGDGNLDYASAFEPEWPVFARNLKAWTSQNLTEGGNARRLRLPFKTARVLIGSGLVAEWGGEAGGSLEASYAPFNQWWDQVEGHVPTHQMATQAMNDGKQGTAVIELDPGEPSWLYTFDGVNSREERLQCTRPGERPRPEPKGWHDLVSLSRQAIGWDPRTGIALPRFVLSGLDIDLRTRDNRNAETACTSCCAWPSRLSAAAALCSTRAAFCWVT